MKHIPVIISLLLLVCRPAQSQWVQINGPELISHFSVHGTTLFAATWDYGAFLSADSGASWVPLGLKDRSVDDLTVSGSYLIAATDAGAFVTPMDNINWTQPSSTLKNHAVTRLAEMGSYVFAGTVDGLFRSSDNGISWSQVNLSLTWILSLCVDGTEIYAGSGYGGIQRSTNAGESWIDASLPGTRQNVFDIVAADGGVYAALDGPAGVYRSTDEGATWTPRGPDLQYFGVNSLVQYGSYLFAGTFDLDMGGAVFRSSNQGASWDSIDTGLPIPGPSNTMVHSLAVCGGELFAGIGALGVWRCPVLDITSVPRSSNLLPASFQLVQNYPNPFNPSTIIKYELPKSSVVRLSVYDILGREVSVLVNERRDAGVHEVKFSARGGSASGGGGSNLASGVYFYRLQAGTYVETKRLLLLR
jgi:hypothetical protein